MSEMSDEVCVEAMCGQEVTYVEEADELLEIVGQVPVLQDKETALTLYNRYHRIVSPPSALICTATGPSYWFNTTEMPMTVP